MEDQLKHKCGIFGVYGKGLEAARLTYFGLYLLSLFLNTRTTLGILFQTLGAASFGGVAYLLVVYSLKMEEILMLNVPATLLNWRGIKNPEPEITGSSLDDQY